MNAVILKNTNTSNQYAYSPFCFPYLSSGADRENLIYNQELLQSVIISFILVALIKCLIQGLYCEEKLDASHSEGSKD